MPGKGYERVRQRILLDQAPGLRPLREGGQRTVGLPPKPLDVPKDRAACSTSPLGGKQSHDRPATPWSFNRSSGKLKR